MSSFGRVGVKHVEAPKHKAPVGPQTAKVAVTGPLIASDASSARGLGAYRDGVKAAKTQPLAPMPWVGGGWLAGLKNAFVQTYTQTAATQTSAFVARHAKDLGADGHAVMKTLEAKGTFDKVDRNGHNLRDTVDAYLKNGGNPKAATAILKQIENANTINQVHTNTCAGATAQKALCEQDPSKYFRVMTKLADKGHATLPGGIELAVSKDARKAILGSKMDIGERLNSYFQAAATEYANGAAKYDFKTDSSKVDHKGTKHDRTFKGVDLNKARDLNEALMDARTVSPDHVKDAIHRLKGQGKDKEHAVAEFLMNRLHTDKAEGQIGVFLAVQSQHHHKAHLVLVKGRDEDGNFRVTDANGHDKLWSPKHLAQVVCLHGGDKVGDNTGMATTDTSTTTSAPPPRRR